jgi:hypothetical protein
VRRPIPKRLSQRAVRNQLAIMQAMHDNAYLHDNTAPVIEQTSVKKRQPKPRAMREAGANDALKEWRQYRPDVRLWRNNVGAYPLPSGGWLRYGLCPGSADFIGLRSVVITPGMVGKRVAVFLAIESKAPGKDAEKHQETWLNEVRDAGAIAGVARNAQQAEDLLAGWALRMQGDQR